MKPYSNTDFFSDRPAQRRSFDAQAMELCLDPAGLSPPERALGHAFLRLILDPAEYGSVGFISLFLPHGAVSTMEEMPPIALVDFSVINIAPGCWVDQYKPDYLLDVKAAGSRFIARAAVECDGHEFHNNDPAQVSHDRAKDRDLQDMGILILRYTAQDVITDAKACARDAIQILLRTSASRGAA